MKNNFKRLMKLFFKTNPALTIFLFVSMIIATVIGGIQALFIQKVIEIIEKTVANRDWSSAFEAIKPIILFLVAIYIISFILNTINAIGLAELSHKFIYNLRCRLFSHMQKLSIKYFDTNHDGDVMSRYTNDIDLLRQLIMGSLPNVFLSTLTIVTNIFLMFYLSIWLSITIFIGSFFVLFVAKKLSIFASKYFINQQKSIGALEGYVEEALNGQKIIKVFNYEQKASEKFSNFNSSLFHDSSNANKYANSLTPILINMGNAMYITVAVVGAILIYYNVPNISISGLALGISVVIPFLNMTKQFISNVNNVASQVGSIIMGLAGAGRVFEVLDQNFEEDRGTVVLVRGEYQNNSFISKNNGKYFWYNSKNNTYIEVKGDIVLNNVNFAYEKDHQILHNINVYAMSGQKVAFVGATGAGKTTIANLINRFYEIEDGGVTYDGINIKDIKKADLRKSLGIVLQDTQLFSGTVMDNIRYGNLDASDEQCIEAAKLANADSFISRLPKGYNTYITENGSSLSQGQKQLIAIARCAVANPPVMILDEATSSIDTYTEALVQKGMDALMEGRTVFVIAHRLSTIMNSDVIMVMERGEIVERGSHESLINEKGVYYKLYTGAFELE